MMDGRKIILSIGLTLSSIAALSIASTRQLAGQATPAINVFSAVESGNGITLRADQHNIVTCTEHTSSPIAMSALESSPFQFWVYEYAVGDPRINGKFYISPGALALHPEYATIDTLRMFTGGKRYYIMSETDLLFRCGQGLSKPAVCGNGILERGELCDTESDGCNQETCTALDGYICTGNSCTIYIPNLGSEGQQHSTRALEVTSAIEPAAAEHTVSTQHTAPVEEVLPAAETVQHERPVVTVEVSNANRDPDGSSVPSGVYPLGVFRFTGASAKASPASLENIIFTVETGNVVIGAQEFRFYNLRAPDQKIACSTLYSSGDIFLSQQISGKFIVRCAHLATGAISTMITAGEHADFVLEGNVLQSQLSSTGNSRVRIWLERLGQQNGMFGVFGSRTEWLEHQAANPTIRVLPALEPVYSTQYSL